MTQHPAKSKLQLKKHAVSNLSNSELKNINGGMGKEAQVTESRITYCCSHDTCGCTTTITETIVTITIGTV